MSHWFPADTLCSPMPPGADLRSPATRKAGPPGSRTPPRPPPLRGADLMSPTARTDGSVPRPPIAPRVPPGKAAGVPAGDAHWRAADAAFPMAVSPAPADAGGAAGSGTVTLARAATPFAPHFVLVPAAAGGRAVFAAEPALARLAGVTPCAPDGAQGAAAAGIPNPAPLPPPYSPPLEQGTSTARGVPAGADAAHGVPSFRADPPGLPLLVASAGVLAAAFAAPGAWHAEHEMRQSLLACPIALNLLQVVPAGSRAGVSCSWQSDSTYGSACISIIHRAQSNYAYRQRITALLTPANMPAHALTCGRLGSSTAPSRPRRTTRHFAASLRGTFGCLRRCLGRRRCFPGLHISVRGLIKSS